MNNVYNEENSFSFGESNEKSLNYSNISGLGESNYENEDLFNEEVNSSKFDNRINKEYIGEPFNSTFEIVEDNFDHIETLESAQDEVKESFEKEVIVPDTLNDSNFQTSLQENENFENQESIHSEEQVNNFEEQQLEEDVNNTEVQEMEEQNDRPEEQQLEGQINNAEGQEVEEQIFETSSTDLQKLTEYTEEKINSTDIKSLFDRVGVNVKEASDIFKKNTEMKEKLDTRFEELKKLKSEIEKTKKTQYDEINSYKEEVLTKLTEKKEEIEKRLNKLKEFQANLEKEKAEFEEYRKNEKEEIERVQKEIQEAYDSRRDELTHIEDVLRKQKDALDEERSQLSLDMIQYEADKNELANNLLKFNEIVASFTNGMEKIEKE